jgi:predicted secreted Zn-dependent protease
MRSILLAAAVLALAGTSAQASGFTREYTYFSIGGSTLAEIEQELERRGPEVSTTNRRHPGATRMKFTTRVTYGETGGRCGVVKAAVNLNANMILPRWRRPRAAETDVRLIWDTLSADIKRHEESHVVIARNHARELETALSQISGLGTCDEAQARVEQTTARILERHEEEQIRFDRIESANFESRMMRLLEYRMERIENGQLPMP